MKYELAPASTLSLCWRPVLWSFAQWTTWGNLRQKKKSTEIKLSCARLSWNAESFKILEWQVWATQSGKEVQLHIQQGCDLRWSQSTFSRTVRHLKFMAMTRVNGIKTMCQRSDDNSPKVSRPEHKVMSSIHSHGSVSVSRVDGLRSVVITFWLIGQIFGKAHVHYTSQQAALVQVIAAPLALLRAMINNSCIIRMTENTCISHTLRCQIQYYASKSQNVTWLDGKFLVLHTK